jgi:aminoglycoside phosphotransferase (APT) family kinase protein
MTRVPLTVPQTGSAVRPSWEQLPTHVRDAVVEACGADVVASESQGGGFTSGFASRLLLADGRRLFVKAATDEEHPFARPSYEREAAVVRGLPDAVPAPRVLWTRNLGHWFVSAFDDVEARHPLRPWDSGELGRVLDVLALMAHELTPVPVSMPEPSPLESWEDELSFWRRRRADDAAALAVPLPEHWASRSDELADLEEGWTTRCAGSTGLHFDVRDDNLLIRPDGEVLVVDWNHLTLGAAWLDLASLLPSAWGDGLDADALWVAHPLARDVDPLALHGFLAALAGLFVERSADEPMARSPYLRAHQLWWRDATMGWLGSRLGWE